MSKIVEIPDFYEMFEISDKLDLDEIKKKLNCKSLHYKIAKVILLTPNLKSIYDTTLLPNYYLEKSSAFFYWGLIYLLGGFNSKAIEYFNKVDTKNISIEVLYLPLATAYKNVENYDQAEKYLKLLLKTGKNNLDALIAISEVLFLSGKIDECENYAVCAIDIIKNKLKDSLSIGERKDYLIKSLSLYKMVDDFKMCEKIISEIVSLDEFDINSLVNISQFYFDSELYEDSLTYLKKAENIEPNNFRILIELGFVFYELNLPSFAIKYFNKAKKIHPIRKEIAELVKQIKQLRKTNGATIEELIYKKQEKISTQIIENKFEKASIIFFDNEKGIGFAVSEKFKDRKIFLHYFAMKNSEITLSKGDTIRVAYLKKDENYIAYWISNCESHNSDLKTGILRSLVENRNYGILEFIIGQDKFEAIFFLNSINLKLNELEIGKEYLFKLSKSELDSGKIVYNASELSLKK